MTDLGKLFPAGPETSPQHRDGLEQELLAAFDRRRAARPRRVAPWARLAAAAALLLGIFAAARAPAEYPIDVGQHVELQLQGPTRGGAGFAGDGTEPKAEAAIAELQRILAGGEGGPRQVEVRVERRGGATQVRIDVWGDPRADLPQRLRAAFPSAEVRVAPITGRVRTSVAGLLRVRLFATDPAAIDKLRQDIKAQLAAQGHGGDVDIQVDESGGKRRVTVKVKAVDPRH